MSENEIDETLYELANMIAAYSNPQMFPFDIGQMSEEERLKELEALKNIMGEMIG